MSTRGPLEGGGIVPVSLPGYSAPGIVYPGDISLGITVGNRHQHGPIWLMSSRGGRVLVLQGPNLEGDLEEALGPSQTWRLLEGWTASPMRGSSQAVPLATACFDSRRHRQSALRGGFLPQTPPCFKWRSLQGSEAKPCSSLFLTLGKSGCPAFLDCS